MNPVRAVCGNDVLPPPGTGRNGFVLSHADARLVRAGNYGHWNVRRDIAGGNFSSAGGQSLNIAGHGPEEFAMAPAFANQPDSLRRQLGKLAQDAVASLT